MFYFVLIDSTFSTYTFYHILIDPTRSFAKIYATFNSFPEIIPPCAGNVGASAGPRSIE
jgi:hypothetical protein